MTVNGDGCICIFDKTWRVSAPGTIVAKHVDSWRRTSDLPSGGKDHRTFPRGKGSANQGSIPGSLFQPQEPPPEGPSPGILGEKSYDFCISFRQPAPKGLTAVDLVFLRTSTIILPRKMRFCCQHNTRHLILLSCQEWFEKCHLIPIKRGLQPFPKAKYLQNNQ
jgi:hypothetical protein